MRIQFKPVTLHILSSTLCIHHLPSISPNPCHAPNTSPSNFELAVRAPLIVRVPGVTTYALAGSIRWLQRGFYQRAVLCSASRSYIARLSNWFRISSVCFTFLGIIYHLAREVLVQNRPNFNSHQISKEIICPSCRNRAKLTWSPTH